MNLWHIAGMDAAKAWPALPLKEWVQTYQTLHLWTQVVGKVRLTLSPMVNHWWNVSLYVSPRGLTTSKVPYGMEAFEIEFDFIAHRLEIRSSTGQRESLELRAESVAVFYERVMGALRSMGFAVEINTKPQELPNPIFFEKDLQHASYDPEYAHRFWRILLATDMVMNEFRARFIGKCSPVQFFWGSFDLACTRFSGRAAPPRKGIITSEAYSHEVISAGFWPGGGNVEAAFYAYAAPSPAGLAEQAVRPEAASWSKELSEFVLMYDDVRRAENPRTALLEFMQSTYEAGAKLANWDRTSLERAPEAAAAKLS
ncbi:MAG TPA: DUF5996 family protein [Candidatus Acidoferrum sp.]